MSAALSVPRARWPLGLLLLVSLSRTAAAEEPPRSTPEHRALVAEISPGYYRRGRDTPAEFVTSQLGNFHPVVRAIHWLIPERMRRDYFDFGADDASARAVIGRYKRDAERGWAWRAPRREIALPRLAPDAPDWSRAAVFRGEIPLDQGDVPPRGGTVWRVAHDGEYFRWRVEVADDEIRSVRPRPYEADSVECFIKDDPGLCRYWEIVVGPDGGVFAASHHFDRVSGLRASEVFDPGLSRLTVAAAPIPGGYRIEGAMPFSALSRTGRALPHPGARLEFMLVRTDATADGVAKSAPVPLLYDGHNLFGYLTAVLE